MAPKCWKTPSRNWVGVFQVTKHFSEALRKPWEVVGASFLKYF